MTPKSKRPPSWTVSLPSASVRARASAWGGDRPDRLHLGREYDQCRQHRSHLRHSPHLGAPPWPAARAGEARVEGIAVVGLSILCVGIVFYEGLGAEGTGLTGDPFVLLAAIAFGGYTALSMPVLERHLPLTGATYSLLFGELVVLLCSPLPSQVGVGGRRGRQGPGVSVFDHHHGSRFGHHLLWQGTGDLEDHRRCDHPSCSVSRQGERLVGHIFPDLSLGLVPRCGLL